MRPLPLNNRQSLAKARLGFIALRAAGTWTLGCGGGGAGTPPPPLPPSIVVTVAPVSGSVVLGNQVTFTATLTNTADTGVTITSDIALSLTPNPASVELGRHRHSKRTSQAAGITRRREFFLRRRA